MAGIKNIDNEKGTNGGYSEMQWLLEQIDRNPKEPHVRTHSNHIHPNDTNTPYHFIIKSPNYCTLVDDYFKSIAKKYVLNGDTYTFII